MTYKKLFFWFLVVSFALALIVYFTWPETLSYFIEEDGLVENLTAFSYFFTAVVAIMLVRWRPKNLPYLMFIACIGLLGTLDELSFGERLFQLNMPKIGVWKVDGVHDLFYIAYKSMKNFSRAYGYIFYPVLAFAVMGSLWSIVRYRISIAQRIGFYGRREFFHLFYTACALVLFSLLVDIHVFKGDTAFLLEEMSELMSAFALMAACFGLPRGDLYKVCRS